MNALRHEVMDEIQIRLPKPLRVVVEVIRDGRARSKMNEETKRIDAMLMEWAKWGKGALAHLGLPRESLDSRVARFGFVGASQGGPMPEWPIHVALTEKAVLAIRQIERSVVVEEYLGFGEPAEVHARRRHMTVNQYRKLLERARKSIRKELLALSYTFT